MAFGTLKLATSEGYTGGIEIGHGVVGIHPYSGFEDIGKGLAARLQLLCHKIELIQTEILRAFCQHGTDFVNVVVAANGVGDAVVGMPESRIALLEEELIVLGIGGLQNPFAGVGIAVAVDDGEQLAAVLHIGTFDETAESGPILRLKVGGDDTGTEAVETLDVVLECLCTANGEVAVVVVGTLGRSIALEPYLVDGDVVVVAYRIDGGTDFGKFHLVAAVCGVDFGAVDREVNVGRSLNLTALPGLGLRTDINHLGHNLHGGLHHFGLADVEHGDIVAHHMFATSVFATVEHQGGGVHPGFIVRDIAVGEALGHTMATERCGRIVGEDMDIVADIAEITLAAKNADGLQRHGIGAVGDVGGEDDCTVLLDLEGRHVVLDGNDHVLAATVHTGLRHPYPINKDLRRQRSGKEHKGSKKKDGYGVFHCRQKD